MQTVEPRVFREDEIRMLAEAAAQVAPVVSEARTLDRFIAPAQERLWSLARNCGGAGTTIPAACSATSIRCAGGSSTTIPFRCWRRFRWRDRAPRRGELVLHSRINYAYRRQQEYLQADRTWGARHAGVLRPRPVAYFSAEFGLHESIPVYSGGLGVLAGDHIKSASDLGIPLVGVGLFYGQGYFRQRLDRARLAAGRVSPDGCQPVAHGAGDRQERRAGDGADRDPQRRHPRQGLAGESGTLRPASAGFERGRKRSGGPGTDFAPVRRRRARSHPPGVAAGRRRLPRPESHGHHAGRASPERRAQRFCGAGSDSHPHAGRGHSFDEAVPRVSREVVFTTHTPVPAGHDRFNAD